MLCRLCLQDNIINAFQKMAQTAATKSVTASKEFARVGAGFDVVAGKVDAVTKRVDVLSTRMDTADDRIYTILEELSMEEAEEDAETEPDNLVPPEFLAPAAKTMPRQPAPPAPMEGAASSATETTGWRHHCILIVMLCVYNMIITTVMMCI